MSHGTEDLDPAQRKHVEENIVSFLKGLRRRGVSAVGVLTNATSGDRFIYRVSRGDAHVDVQVPGMPLEKVRHVVGFIIDGQSVTWESALDTISSRLRPADNSIEMLQLRAAIEAGRRVEIRVAASGIGSRIGGARAASIGHAASNDRGERAARLIEEGTTEEDGLVDLETGVSAEQAAELIGLGAVEA